MVHNFHCSHITCGFRILDAAAHAAIFMYGKRLWSNYSIQDLNLIDRVLRQWTMAVISLSCTLYPRSVSLSLRLSKAMGCPSCISTPPMERSEASVWTSSTFSKSGKTRTGSCVTAAFNSSKAFWHLLVHSHDLLFFNSSAAFAENPLMNRR